MIQINSEFEKNDLFTISPIITSFGPSCLTAVNIFNVRIYHIAKSTDRVIRAAQKQSGAGINRRIKPI